ncbi:MAG: NUDIX hydrolase [Sedimentisphaerales bacterium]|nr:NUDIX hydrolase [Sedimentisphaerales bacterium]
MEPQWLIRAKRLAALAQNGLAYTRDDYDRQRYEQIRQIAVEWIADASNLTAAELLEIYRREDGYATPKVDVRAVIFRQERILLVRERSDGKWSLPGGWADVGESARQCVQREAAEESGFEVRARKLLAVYDRSLHPHRPAFAFHVYKLFFRCDICGGRAAETLETSAVEFFAEDRLPELSETKITAQQIARMFEHLRHPDWPADFD